MTVQRNKLHALYNRLGATERVPFAGLDVRRCDGLRALEKRLGILRRLGGDFWRQPKLTIFLRDVDLGIWKDALSVLSGETTNVIGVKARSRRALPVPRPTTRDVENSIDHAVKSFGRRVNKGRATQ